MPDQQGKMTPDETRRAQEWLASHWGNVRCPMSGHVTWQIGDSLITTLPYTGQGLTLGGPSYPMLVVICTGCGFTALVNALMSGIVPRQIPPEPQVSTPPPTPDLTTPSPGS